MATAFIFVFGVFEYKCTGALPIIGRGLMGVALAVAPMKATRAIWKGAPTAVGGLPPEPEPPKG